MPLPRPVVRLTLVGVLLTAAACAGSPHPDVDDTALACAAAWETRGTVAEADDGDAADRAAAVLREVATGQFVLTPLRPDDAVVAAAADRARAATETVQAAAGINTLTEVCAEADVPSQLDGSQHTTAACRQLTTLADEVDDGDAPGRTAFVVDHLGRTAEEVDPQLQGVLTDLAAAASDAAAAGEALRRGGQVCAELRGS